MARKTPQKFRRLASKAITASATVTLDIPTSGIMAAIEIVLSGAFTTTGGAVTVVDSTRGLVLLAKRIQMLLDGSGVPLSISGRNLDLWSHIDRPGSERTVTVSTTSGNTWEAVIRWEVAQSEVNLGGALDLGDFGTVQLEIDFDALSVCASGTGLAFTGTVEAWGELYDPTLGIVFDKMVRHCLSERFHVITASGEQAIAIPRGRALERMILVVENNSVIGAQDVISNFTLSLAEGDQPLFRTDLSSRAALARNYGGDDMPVAGVHVLDFRRAGDRDVIPLGDKFAAPYPELIFNVSATPALTNCKLHIIREELERVEVAAA